MFLRVQAPGRSFCICGDWEHRALWRKEEVRAVALAGIHWFVGFRTWDARGLCILLYLSSGSWVWVKR